MTDRTTRKRQLKAAKARRRSVNSGVRASGFRRKKQNRKARDKCLDKE